MLNAPIDDTMPKVESAEDPHDSWFILSVPDGVMRTRTHSVSHQCKCIDPGS
jgi:hypothetical protein